MAQIEVTEGFLKLLKKADVDQNEKGEYVDENLFSKLLLVPEHIPLIHKSEAAVAERLKHLDDKVQELSKNKLIETASAAADILKIDVPKDSSIREVMKLIKAKIEAEQQPKETDTAKEIEKFKAAFKEENEKALKELNQKAEGYSNELKAFKDKEFEQGIIQDFHKHTPQVKVGGESKKKYDIAELAKSQKMYIINRMKELGVVKFNEAGHAIGANGSEIVDNSGILSAAKIWDTEAAEMGLNAATYTNGVPLGIQSNTKPLAQMSRAEQIEFTAQQWKK